MDRIASEITRCTLPDANPEDDVYRILQYAGQNHRGVGLSITRILAKEAGGQLTIASEGGWFDELHGTEQAGPRQAISFPGTLVAVSLHRDQIADYAAMHAEAMSQIEMGSIDTPGMFME